MNLLQKKIRNTLCNLGLLFCFVLGVQQVQAQDLLPVLSSPSEVKEKVGYTDIEIEYSRPSMRGRKIFGELVKYGTIWRAGANGDTKITFSTEVTIGGKELKRGTYSIFAKPNVSSWTVYFYQKSPTETFYSGVPSQNPDSRTAWSAEKLKLEYEVPVQKVDPVETLTVGIQNISAGKADIFIAWEDVKVTIPFVTKSVEWAVSSIEGRINGPSAWDYYNFASFYVANSLELDKALEYINSGMGKLEKPSWWFHRSKSQILEKLKRYDEALRIAKEGLEIGKKNENSDYYVSESTKDITRLEKERNNKS